MEFLAFSAETLGELRGRQIPSGLKLFLILLYVYPLETEL